MALLAITAIAVYLCWLMIEPFFQVIVWAAVLAIVSYPVYQRLIRWGRSPTVSAILTTLLVVLTVVVPLTLLGLALVREITDAVPRVRAGITELLDSDLFKPDSPVRQWVERYFGVESLNGEFITSRLNALGTIVAKETVGIVGDIFSTAVQGFFVLFTLYYLLRDADRIIGATREFIPLEPEQTDRILRQTHEVISASLHGVLSIAAIQGALGGAAFWVLGLASPLLWGVVMFFMSMIPMAGAFFVWVPAAIYLLVTGHWVKALILALWGGLVIGTIDNFLRPRLVGQKTRLHELVVLFSVLGGLKVFGVLGLVVGPVVVAITLALIDVLRHANVVEEPSVAPSLAGPPAEAKVATAVERASPAPTAGEQPAG
jgi:predicted PurR-regulated permease PerM